MLYGAATFSEDIDLWIKPSAENCACFQACLRRCEARYYKLTPSLTPANLLRGHGFHFVMGAGGAAVFAERAFRRPLVSFLVGFSMLAAGVTSAAGLSLAFSGDYLATLVEAPAIPAAIVFLALVGEGKHQSFVQKG